MRRSTLCFATLALATVASAGNAESPPQTNQGGATDFGSDRAFNPQPEPPRVKEFQSNPAVPPVPSPVQEAAPPSDGTKRKKQSPVKPASKKLQADGVVGPKTIDGIVGPETRGPLETKR